MRQSAKLKLGGGGINLLDTNTILYGKAQYITNIDYKSIKLNKLVFESPLIETSVLNKQNNIYETHIKIIDNTYYSKPEINVNFQQKLIPNLGIKITDNSNISVNFNESGWINNNSNIYSYSNIGIGTSTPLSSLHIYNKNPSIIIEDNLNKYKISSYNNYLTFGTTNNSEQLKIHRNAPNNSLYIDSIGNVNISSNLIITGTTNLTSELFINNDNIINWLSANGIATLDYVANNNYMQDTTIIKGIGTNITNINYNNIQTNKLNFTYPLINTFIDNLENTVSIDLSLTGWSKNLNDYLYTTSLNSKIGIGTTIPLGTLHIGSISYSIENQNNDGSIIVSKSSAKINKTFKFGYDDNFNFALGNLHTNNLLWNKQLIIFNSAPESSLIINNLGDVILNNSINIISNINLKGSIYINNNIITTDTNNFIIGNYPNNTTFNKNFIINNIGNIGIGISPQNTYKLIVNGSIKSINDIYTTQLVSDSISTTIINILDTINISSNLISPRASLTTIVSSNINNVDNISTNTFNANYINCIYDFTSLNINSINNITGNSIICNDIINNNLITTQKIITTDIISSNIRSDTINIQNINGEILNITKLNATDGIITSINTINTNSTNIISSTINNNKLISSYDIYSSNNITTNTFSSVIIISTDINSCNINTSNINATSLILANNISAATGDIKNLLTNNLTSTSIYTSDTITCYKINSTINYATKIGINLNNPQCELHVGMSTDNYVNCSFIIDGPINHLKMGYDNYTNFIIGDYNTNTNIWTKQIIINADAPDNSLVFTSLGNINIGTITDDNRYKVSIIGTLNASEGIYQNGIKIISMEDVTNSINTSLTPYLTTAIATSLYPTNYQVTTQLNSYKNQVEGTITTLLSTTANIYSQEKRFPLNTYNDYKIAYLAAMNYTQINNGFIYAIKSTVSTTVTNNDNTVSLYNYSIYSNGLKNDRFLLLNYEDENFYHKCEWGINSYDNNNTFINSKLTDNDKSNTIYNSLYYGDFVIIQSEFPITLTRFRFYVINTYKFSAPGVWKCYGSTDCNTWSEIIKASTINQIYPNSYIDTGYGNSYYEQTFENVIGFTYIGFVFSKLVYTPPTGNLNTLRLSRIELFGKEIMKPIYVSSNVLQQYLLNYTTFDDINLKQDTLTFIEPLYNTGYNEIGIDPTFFLGGLNNADNNILNNLSNAIITYINKKVDIWNVNNSGNIYFNNGNIGIGTSYPNNNYKLQVIGNIDVTNINANSILLLNNIKASYFEGNGSLLTNIDYNSLTNKPVLTNLNNWTYVSGNYYTNTIGNVGIGYTTGANIGNTLSVNGSIFAVNNINAKINLQENNINISDKYLSISSATTTYLNLNGGSISGSVGIGTNILPDFRLNVNGSIYSNSNINAINFIENDITLSSKYLTILNANNTFLSKISGGIIQNNLTIFGTLKIGTNLQNTTDNLSIDGSIFATNNIKTNTNFIENGCNLIDKYLTISNASNIYFPFSGGIITSNLTINSNIGVGISASTNYNMNINGTLNTKILYINDSIIDFNDYVSKINFNSSLLLLPTYNYLNNTFVFNSNIPELLMPYDKIIDRENIITNLSNIYISSNVILNYLTPYDKIIDRNNAITNLSSTYITSNQFYNYVNNYSIERKYPPIIFNNYTDPVNITFLNQSYTIHESIIISNASYGNGTYDIFSSSIVLNKYKRLIFDGISNNEAVWNYNYISDTGYYNSDKYILNDYKGDWLIIKFPFSLILTKFRFFYTQTNNVPGLWRCYGSNDGINFTQIIEASNDINSIHPDYYDTNGFYEKIVASTFQIHYTYIGWCINKLTGSGTTLIIEELEIFGKEIIDHVPFNPIYVSSNVLTNYLLNYDKIIDRQIEINNLANIYITKDYYNNNLLSYSMTGNDANYLKLSGGIITGDTYFNNNLISSNIINSNLIITSNIICSNQIITNSIISKTITTNKINIGTNIISDYILNINGSLNTASFYINGTSIDFNSFTTIDMLNSSLQLYPTFNYLSNNYIASNILDTKFLSYSPTGTDPNYLKLTGNGLFSGNITFTGLFVTANISNVSTIITSNLKVYSDIITSNIQSTNLINLNSINTNSIITNNIGIGTTFSPLYKLIVNGSIYTSNDIICTGNIKENGSNLQEKYLSINNAINTYFPISGGNITNNVCIGTNISSFYKLNVNGSIFSSNNINCAGNIQENGSNLIDKYLTIQTASNNYLPISGGIITSNLTITGNVGIGTSATGVYRVNIKGPVFCNGIIETNTDIRENSIKLRDTYLTIANAASIYLPINGGVINNNIGIGTTTSTLYKLNVNGSIYSSNNIFCSGNFVENGLNLNDKYLSISNAPTYIINSDYFKSDLMSNQPNLQKKFGFRFLCNKEISLNNEIYYKHDIDLQQYVKNKTDSIDANPYRIFGIKCFATSAIFNIATPNKPPNILQYDIYMSYLANTTIINVCAVGFPSNYFLNRITAGDIFILKTSNYNYISILARTYNLSVSCIISDFLF